MPRPSLSPGGRPVPGADLLRRRPPPWEHLLPHPSLIRDKCGGTTDVEKTTRSPVGRIRREFFGCGGFGPRMLAPRSAHLGWQRSAGGVPDHHPTLLQSSLVGVERGVCSPAWMRVRAGAVRGLGASTETRPGPRGPGLFRLGKRRRPRSRTGDPVTSISRGHPISRGSSLSAGGGTLRFLELI
jgi:hypothetical protein